MEGRLKKHDKARREKDKKEEDMQFPDDMPKEVREQIKKKLEGEAMGKEENMPAMGNEENMPIPEGEEIPKEIIERMKKEGMDEKEIEAIVKQMKKEEKEFPKDME